MRIASTIARYLLGLIFTVFGLNGFLHFLPQPPMTGPAGQYFVVLATTNYLILVFAIQLACGLLFLAGRYVPLALTLVAPVIVNILMFHALMNPSGIIPGLIVAVCWSLVFARVRHAFDGIFAPRMSDVEYGRP
ncbi:MAG TPA: hypothetical protein VGD56_18900 [Gemmatirosa sp.]